MAEDRRSYDTDASATVQGDLMGIIGNLERVIGERTRQVETAMADFTATNVDEQYRSVEVRWYNAANQVNEIIGLVKNTLTRNDESATAAQSQASNAVAGIG